MSSRRPSRDARGQSRGRPPSRTAAQCTRRDRREVRGGAHGRGAGAAVWPAPEGERRGAAGGGLPSKLLLFPLAAARGGWLRRTGSFSEAPSPDGRAGGVSGKRLPDRRAALAAPRGQRPLAGKTYSRPRAESSVLSPGSSGPQGQDSDASRMALPSSIAPESCFTRLISSSRISALREGS